MKAEYIIIVDGGRLQIGTEKSPFLHKSMITMYGSVRSLEIPIYGSKVRIKIKNLNRFKIDW